jgi:O-antigen/teichoic acid export membrane protein
VSQIRQSLVLSFAGKYTSLAVSTFATVILARLLTPEDTGLYTIAAAVTAMAHCVRDFGTGTYLIQLKELSLERIRSVFTITLLFALGIALALFFAKDSIASFYEDPRLQTVLSVSIVNFIVIPFGSISLVLLRREMNFHATYLIGVTGTTTHAVVAIWLAYQGAGAVSLAWASLANVVVVAALASWLRPIPSGHRVSLKGALDVLRFGSYATSAYAIHEAGVRAPELLIGRVLGMHALGLFSRAVGLTALFDSFIMQAIGAVALPAFAQRFRDGGDVRSDFLRGLEYMTVVAWPFYAALGFLAEPFIRILLGSQWLDASPILQVLCISASIGSLASINWIVFQGTGSMRQNLIVHTASAAVQIVCIAIAAFYGLVAVAIALVAATAAQVVFSFCLIHRIIRVSLPDALWATRKSFLVAAGTALPLILTQLMQLDTDWIVLLGSIAGAAACWAISLRCSRHPFFPELLEILRTGRDLITRAPRTATDPAPSQIRAHGKR